MKSHAMIPRLAALFPLLLPLMLFAASPAKEVKTSDGKTFVIEKGRNFCRITDKEHFGYRSGRGKHPAISPASYRRILFRRCFRHCK